VRVIEQVNVSDAPLYDQMNNIKLARVLVPDSLLALFSVKGIQFKKQKFTPFWPSTFDSAEFKNTQRS